MLLAVVLSTKDFNKGANVTAENLLNGRAGLTVNTSGARLWFPN
jgi:iron complex outermembrane receptor protein